MARRSADSKVPDDLDLYCEVSASMWALLDAKAIEEYEAVAAEVNAHIAEPPSLTDIYVNQSLIDQATVSLLECLIGFGPGQLGKVTWVAHCMYEDSDGKIGHVNVKIHSNSKSWVAVPANDLNSDEYVAAVVKWAAHRFEGDKSTVLSESQQTTAAQAKSAMDKQGAHSSKSSSSTSHKNKQPATAKANQASSAKPSNMIDDDEEDEADNDGEECEEDDYEEDDDEEEDESVKVQAALANAATAKKWKEKTAKEAKERMEWEESEMATKEGEEKGSKGKDKGGQGKKRLAEEIAGEVALPPPSKDTTDDSEPEPRRSAQTGKGENHKNYKLVDGKYKVLDKLRLARLEYLAMSTDVERLFSHSGLNVTKWHHNLSAESTITQTVLNSWIKYPGLVDDDELTKFFNNKSKRPNNRGKKVVTAIMYIELGSLTGVCEGFYQIGHFLLFICASPAHYVVHSLIFPQFILSFYLPFKLPVFMYTKHDRVQCKSSFAQSTVDDETEEELDANDGTITMMMTTVIKSPSHSTTPRFQTPPPSRVKNHCSTAVSMPGHPSPLLSKLCQKTPSAEFDHPSPMKTPVSGMHAGNMQNVKAKGKGKAKQPSTPKIHYHIPHPDELPCPGRTFPVLKKWHVVTVGQDVGIFSSCQALKEYHHQYEAGNIEIVLLPSSEWVKAACLEDEYGQLEYDEDVEQALCEAEAHAAAEDAYKVAMEACGYKV
ncbi:hypothetical protein ARMGADRAFT_1038015 [Armillaria gallica]|uniref:HAT C-terminal dimerisation domain-containing protein n=1 Tax=Armillaria gallica TaxID=47427 RepID=A0A2H3CPA0_ARMGA|nr:hypothetical protein ARMGADRAFT_1038015 [Armillaria gallica]